jgi:phosphohistidine phosphatase SixA
VACLPVPRASGFFLFSSFCLVASTGVSCKKLLLCSHHPNIATGTERVKGEFNARADARFWYSSVRVSHLDEPRDSEP